MDTPPKSTVATYLGIDHVGVAVNDLAAATATYRDVLGFPIQGGEVLPERGLEVTFVNAGNTRIELIAPTRGDSEVSSFLAKRGEGVHHICMRVGDIRAALEGLQERGAQIVGKGISQGAHGHLVAFLHPKGTHGVLLELVQHVGEKSHD